MSIISQFLFSYDQIRRKGPCELQEHLQVYFSYLRVHFSIYNWLLPCLVILLRSYLSLCGIRGTTHRHIILAVRHEDDWGAIGLSRRKCLMGKKIEFKTLTDLLRHYELSYVRSTIRCDYSLIRALRTEAYALKASDRKSVDKKVQLISSV